MRQRTFLSLVWVFLGGLAAGCSGAEEDIPPPEVVPAWTGVGLLDKPIHGIAVDPGCPATLYAVTTTKVYKSTDRGLNWTDLAQGLDLQYWFPDVAGEGVAVSHGSPGKILVGNSNFCFLGTNGGASWRRPRFAGGGSAFAFDPRTPNTVYAGGRNVAKSVNGGETWSGLGQTSSVRALAIDPVNPSVLYAGRLPGLFQAHGRRRGLDVVRSVSGCGEPVHPCPERGSRDSVQRHCRGV